MRTLADLEVAGTAAPGSAFAEKLGLWVSFTDAIALSALHSHTPNPTHVPIARQHLVKDANIAKDIGKDISEDVASTHASLVQWITQRRLPAGGKAPIQWPELPDTAPVDAMAYEPYRRFYRAHQREMEATLGPLRARVRVLLSGVSPALKQLADLDAALERILYEREANLLSKVAALLQRRFMHLLQTHPQTHPQDHPGGVLRTGQTDKPALWTKDGAWLARFCHELQTLLLAELDLRLQPTLGLLEAYKNETPPPL